MNSLLEGWRKYILETEQLELGSDDNDKLISIFLGSGIQAKELARATNNQEIMNFCMDTMTYVESFIKYIDMIKNQTKQTGADMISNLAVADMDKKADELSERFLVGGYIDRNDPRWRDLEDTIYQAGDHIWEEITVPPTFYNTASPEAAAQSYQELRTWVGLGI
tara:strand:+ start:1123 stop:1617 length:495 start_codon:yes stop_codon:yes gene_type:complete